MGQGGWGGGEHEPGGFEGCEGLGEGEVLVEEEGDGDDFRAGVAAGAGTEVAVWGLEEEGGEAGVVGAKTDGEGGSGSGSVDDDGGDGETAGGGEVEECGVGVGLHGGLGGVEAEGAAVAAVVE